MSDEWKVMSEKLTHYLSLSTHHSCSVVVNFELAAKFVGGFADFAHAFAHRAGEFGQFVRSEQEQC